ncbi:SCO2525 family SAM-dependent methyltransferase [Stackebrandtia nassauensis]|uniref:Methyltransferase NNMT/PNMT/TEMT n=1 Tax=Stackebrandtia nassauensis (strain DSM 44728 / CIP 108903 / NRRL B-16338 / NBRC 102104 / LLR-40K-21) TaxID=446470 RepID=D3QB54_STANL|nr:SCO2525 family SAM-dependent methyltransferase [Stackebrandtia nassauensis]ADD40871.1 Methyltransferase NNMT/PNMT/TEMT [Stackebrandtia nassauensis DSM 44728]
MSGSTSQRALNDAYEWDRFNPESYQQHNYRDLRSDDREILEIIRDHFTATAPDAPVTGIDVGAGPNLYPTLSMLPFCDDIELYEYSNSNVEWLREQIKAYDHSWDKFWGVLEQSPEYSKITDPRQRLASIARVTQGSIFDLPRRRWGMGTMFFVAESLTQDMDEFRLAVAKFAGALLPGAPFAAAFMKESHGYRVDDTAFPAVAINSSHVAQCFQGITSEVLTTEVTFEHPLRDGYDGMIVATGLISAASDLWRDDEDSAQTATARCLARSR